jgi:hypothetical protein
MVLAPRASRWLMPLLLLGGALLAPGERARRLPVAIYPLASEGLRPEQADLIALLEAGLRRRAARAPPGPRLPPSCGPTPADACLAGLADGGAVLLARASRRGAEVQVTAVLVDARGRRTRAATFALNLAVQSTRPVGLALEVLEFELLEPPPPQGVAAAAPPRAIAAPAPSATPAPALGLERAGPAATVWRREAGQWTTAGGLVLLCGGGAAAWLGARLTKDLDARYQGGLLRPEDAADYRRVERYGAAATTLLVAGGVLTATGLTLWALAPEVTPVRGGAAFGVKGRF